MIFVNLTFNFLIELFGCRPSLLRIDLETVYVRDWVRKLIKIEWDIRKNY